jgi:hypothetical protein
MFENLYLSLPVVSCFDDAADAAAKAAADAAAAAAATAAGAGGANDPPKTFTQDEVNRILAEDKRKHQAALLKTESTYKELLANNNTLTAKERQTLEENLVTVQGQLRTKEEQAKMEKKQLEETLNSKIAEEQAKAKNWETRYKEETVTRALSDAAASGEAFQPNQIVTLLKGMTKLVEEVDEQSGKATGRYKTVVEFPDVDAEGNPTTSVRTPSEAVKRMKELPEIYGNLFKSNVVSGIGSNSTTGVTPGHNGKINLRNLTPQQYRELREKNPEALGLKARPKGSRR